MLYCAHKIDELGPILYPIEVRGAQVTLSHTPGKQQFRQALRILRLDGMTSCRDFGTQAPRPAVVRQMGNERHDRSQGSIFRLLVLGVVPT